MQHQLRRILFFHQGRMSDYNSTIWQGLQSTFPTAEVRHVDINQLIKRRFWLIGLNIGAILADYGLEVICKRRLLDDAFFGTRFMFRRVRELVARVHAEWPADCSFQTDSIFDSSYPGVPHYIYTDHTYQSCKEYPYYGREVWSPIRPDWLIQMERGTYQNATCIFTRSGNVTRKLLDFYNLPTNKVRQVNAGCNVNVATLSQLSTDEARYAQHQLLFVGRSWELKGGPELLQAFRELRQEFPNLKLDIVGCTPNLSEPGVQMFPFVPLNEVAKFYARSSIFVMPSKIEAFGIVFLEALAAGLPVVALKLGAAPDFVRDRETGFAVEPGHVPALVESLRFLLRNPAEGKRMGENGRRLVTSEYTWDYTFQCIRETVMQFADARHSEQAALT